MDSYNKYIELQVLENKKLKKHQKKYKEKQQKNNN